MPGRRGDRLHLIENPVPTHRSRSHTPEPRRESSGAKKPKTKGVAHSPTTLVPPGKHLNPSHTPSHSPSHTPRHTPLHTPIPTPIPSVPPTPTTTPVNTAPSTPLPDRPDRTSTSSIKPGATTVVISSSSPVRVSHGPIDKRTGRYLALGVTVIMIFITFYNTFRQVPMLTGLIPPAIIMILYLLWIVYFAKKRKRQAEIALV